MADFSSINVGDVLPSKSLSVDQALINDYADICGDYNTLHVDVEGMKDHPLFGGTIAHGTINVEPVLQAICEVQGTKWPNAGTTIDLQFRAPVKPGMTITSELKVKDKKDNTLFCDMQILDQDGNTCVRGSAEIII